MDNPAGNNQAGQQQTEVLDDVFEAERALTGETLAFAAAAQILSVRSFGVHMA